MAEPQPEIFKKVQENYRDHPQLLFENSALSQRDGDIELHCFANAGVKDHASMLTSTRKHYLILNGDSHRGELKPITVPALTLKSLIAKHGVKKVHILQIDTEGFDFEVIKMIDFQQIKPEIIHYGNNFMNRRQKSECARILSDQNYSLLNLGIDTLAYLQPANDEFKSASKRAR